MRRQMWAALALVLCLAGFSSVAIADSTQSWYLTGSNDQSAVPCTSAVPCAEVNLDVNGSTAIFTVTSLLNGYIFDTFGFNTINGVSVSLVSASGEVGSYSLGGSGNEDGWGSFKYNFDTGKSGGSDGGDCVNQGAGCTFTFTLSSASSLTLADFEKLSSGGAGSGFFAGHLANGNGNTGYVGDTQPFTPVSEPASMAILIPGMLAGVGFLRRRVLL